VPNLAIDVPLPDNVKEFLAQPHCIDLALPKPSKVEVCLPLGGRIQGLVDATKEIPDDCSLTFSLLLQLGPIMASIECLIKVLKLIKPLIDVIKAVPDPLKLAKVVPDFIKAAEDVLPCVLQVTLGVPMFVRDLLLLIAKVLHCIAGTLKSIAGLMGGIQLSIATAQKNGNAELLAQLQCAQENAQCQAAAAMSSIDAIAAILSLAEPFLGIAGVDPIVLPTAGSAEDAQSLETTAETLLQVSQTLITIAEALPGCG
jgi:hypothetical protein